MLSRRLVLVMASTTLAGCTHFAVKRACADGPAPACFDELGRAAKRSKSGRERYRAYVASLPKMCAAGVDEPEPPENAYREFGRRDTAATFACVYTAALQLGVLDAPDGYFQPFAGAPIEGVVPLDRSAAIATLERLCNKQPWTDWRLEACAMLGDLRAVQAAVDAGDLAAAMRVAEPVPVDGVRPRWNHVWLTPSVLERLIHGRDASELTAALDRISAAIDARRLDPATVTAITGTCEMVRRLDPAQKAKPDERLRALVNLFVEQTVENARSTRHYLHALERVETVRACGDARRMSAQVSTLRAEGGRFHAELAATQESSGRLASALLHDALAQRLGETPRFPAEARDKLHFRPGARVTMSASCPWLEQPPNATASGGAPDLALSIDIRRCESGQREWEESASETFTVKEAVERERMVEVREPSQVCTASGCQSVTVKRTVAQKYTEYVEIPKVVHRKDRHRETKSVLDATVTVRNGDASDVIALYIEPPVVKEVETPLRASTFLRADTLPNQRQKIIDEVRYLTETWSRALQPMMAKEAQRRLTNGRALASSDPLAAEEEYCRAVLTSQDEAAEAWRWLLERHGLTGEQLAKIFGIHVREAWKST